jgi:hypothetical protein
MPEGGFGGPELTVAVPCTILCVPNLGLTLANGQFTKSPARPGNLEIKCPLGIIESRPIMVYCANLHRPYINQEREVNNE